MKKYLRDNGRDTSEIPPAICNQLPRETYVRDEAIRSNEPPRNGEDASQASNGFIKRIFKKRSMRTIDEEGKMIIEREEVSMSIHVA